MNVLVTGGAGFIGSHLCDSLIEKGYKVWCLDNLYLGKIENIAHLQNNPDFKFLKVDLLDAPALDKVFADTSFDRVYHLAANSDIEAGSRNHKIDLDLNFMTTFALLETMLKAGVKKLFFSSTSAVFGESPAKLHEDYGPLKPISFYGASKLAAEGYISVFVDNYGFQAWVARFPNVIGERSTHGAIHDFIKRLKADPSKLRVLGDGTQTKPYLYVKDLVEAINLIVETTNEKLNVYHVGNEDLTNVKFMVETVISEMGLNGIPIEWTGGAKGWVGDVPYFHYDISKIKSLGWAPKHNSAEAVRTSVRRILGKE